MDQLELLPIKLLIKSADNRVILAHKIQSSEITIEENGSLTLIALLTTGTKEKAKINFHLAGQHSEIKFIGINIGQGENTFSLETNSLHTTTNTKAFYYLRSALFDKSSIDFTGTLIIKKAAQLTDSYLSHSTLMLSTKAKANTTPSLEIEADDVKAGHSATIGSTDEETLFYLQSRGLTKKEAQKTMIKGFLEQDLHQIEDKNSREEVAKTLENLLNKALN